MTDKRKNKSTLFKEKLDKLMLLKVGRGYKISGGGKLLIWFKYIDGGTWKKYEKANKRNKGVLEEIKTFREQERKYGVTIKVLKAKEKTDINDMDFVYIKRRTSLYR